MEDSGIEIGKILLTKHKKKKGDVMMIDSKTWSKTVVYKGVFCKA